MIEISNEAIEKLKESIKKGETIYDILAAARETLDVFYPNEANDVNLGEYKTLIDLVNSFDKGFYGKLDSERFNISNLDFYFSQLCNNIINWLENRDVVYRDVYTLIIAIDSTHSYKEPGVKSSKTVMYTRFQGPLEPSEDRKILAPIKCLNANQDSTGYIVLPRLHNGMARKMMSACEKEVITKRGKRKEIRYAGSANSSHINSRLKNYDIIHKPRSDEFYPVIHRFKSDAALHVLKRLVNKGDCLRVGLFPLWIENLGYTLDVLLNEPKTMFYIQGMCDAKKPKLLERFKSAIDRCIEMNVDIAIFPEMIMSRDILEELKDYLGHYTAEIRPVLIAMGSIWEEGGKDGVPFNRNVSPVLSCWSDHIFDQNKQTPFIQERDDLVYPDYHPVKGLYENLSLRDKSINIIDIEGVGRFFVQICIDARNPDLSKMMKDLRADVVLLPAFSRSPDLITEYRSLASAYWSTALICNCCSAQNETEGSELPDEVFMKAPEVGTVLVPFKDVNYEDGRTVKFNISDSCKNCGKSVCQGAFFDILYNEYTLYNENDKSDTRGWINVEQKHLQA